MTVVMMIIDVDDDDDDDDDMALISAHVKVLLSHSPF
jgi:hypothetical protein